MSLDYVKFTPGFEQFMPKEYRDMVEHGPFGKKTTVSQMGSFKEILEEHPMCAGCAMTLFIRLAVIAFPNPEDTITVGTAGCGRLAISQAAIPFVYGNYGDQNGVASGLSRGLRLRFGDKPKDVVVMAGDGGMADIGFSCTLHSWFRKEKFTTIMLDNEVYGNTGGQESGMTTRGAVLKMAPLGKKFEKMDMVGMARVAGCAYVATVVPNNPRRVEAVIRKAVLIAREVGPTYIQAYTSCNIEYAIPTDKVMEDANTVEDDRYKFTEYISDEAKEYLADRYGYKFPKPAAGGYRACGDRRPMTVEGAASMTDTLPLPPVKEPRDLTNDQRIAAEAAFRGLPADPKWPTSARQIYEGLVAAIRVRDAEVDRRTEAEALQGSPR